MKDIHHSKPAYGPADGTTPYGNTTPYGAGPYGEKTPYGSDASAAPKQTAEPAERNRPQPQEKEIHHNSHSGVKKTNRLPLIITAGVMSFVGAILLVLGIFVFPEQEMQQTIPAQETVETAPASGDTAEQPAVSAGSETPAEPAGSEEPASVEEPVTSDEAASTETTSEEPAQSQEEPASQPQQEELSGMDPTATVPQDAFGQAQSAGQEHGRPVRSRGSRSIELPVKWILIVSGLLLLLVGTVLALIACALLRKDYEMLFGEWTTLRSRLASQENAVREPTTKEKLADAFKKIPVLRSSGSQAAPRSPAAAERHEPIQRQNPVPQMAYASVAPQAPVDPAMQVDQQVNGLLAAGSGQEVAKKMITSSSFEGATVDFQQCLVVYQAGRDCDYRVTPCSKDWNSAFYMTGRNTAVTLLYPNTYQLENQGAAKMQESIYLLKAFDIVLRGTALTAQQLPMTAGARVVKLQGAHLDAENVVTQKGIIEME